jgi:eukaryotic-like serine/threonine-protein kinase
MVGLKAGAHVSTYVLQKQLGEGGQGSVWEVSQPHSVDQITKAMKIIPVKWSSQTTVERVRREAEALQKLSLGHPSVVR